MDSGEGGKGPDFEMLFSKLEAWLKINPKLSLAGIVLVALGFLGGITTGGGFFWFLFFIGGSGFCLRIRSTVNHPWYRYSCSHRKK